MIVVREIVAQVLSRKIDSGDAVRLLESYRGKRTSANITDWRNREGESAKELSNQLKKLVNDVLAYLRNVDSMTYYPMVVDGVGCYNREEVLRELLTGKLNNYNKVVA